MSTTGQNRVQQLLDEGYDFKFGQYISDGFSLLQKNLGGFIGFIILVLIISSVMSMIPIVGNLGVFITTPLMAGMYLVAAKVKNGEHNEFGDFFKGFDFIGPLAIMTLITFGLYIVAAIPFFIYMGTSLGPLLGDLGSIDPEDPTFILEIFANINFGLSFLLMLPLVYLGIAWSWATFFIVFHKMSPWEALESSRKVITKKFFMFLLFGIVVGIIAVAGMIAFLIGMLFTIPAMMLASFAAFEDIVGLGDENNDNQDSILDHLVGE
jgi:hypothetical protein